MRRREFLGRAAAAAAALPWLGRRARAADRSPNFVVILIDDMGYGDVEPFGSRLNRTPHLTRMAAEGLKLTDFYAAPVCTPSRAQLLTGCYAKRVSLPNVIFPAAPIGLHPNERTVATLLRERGYATMCIGKWHVGDQPEFLPTRHGFDHYLGIPYSNDMGGPVQPGPGEKDPRPPLPLLQDAAVVEAPAQQDQLVQRYTTAAVQFIQDNQQRPFFLYLPHNAVHVPLHPGAAFAGMSHNGTYGDWVEEVDGSVGRVLDTLRDLKLERETLVLFTSDNGPWLTQGARGGVAGPLRNGKGTTWEGGVREPTLAWWPGHIAPGTTCDAPVSELDILPTLVGLAGGQVPTDRAIDGRDIAPILTGQTRQSPHEALYYFNGNRLEAVRSGPWKLAIAPQPAEAAKAQPTLPASRARPRLYHLVADLGETTDVAADHPEVVARLLRYVEAMDRDLGATGLGPGVRPPGRVSQPVALRRLALEYD